MQMLEVVSNDGHGIRDVEQNQSSDHCVERCRIAPPGDIALDERNVGLVRVLTALSGHGERADGAIDSHDSSFGPDELASHPCHVAKSGAQIENPHASLETGGVKQQSCC